MELSTGHIASLLIGAPIEEKKNYYKERGH